MILMKQLAGTAALGMAMLIGLSAPPAKAGFIMYLAQVGSNVVAFGSGTINLTDLTPFDPLFYDFSGALIWPSQGSIQTGPLANNSGDPTGDNYGGNIGPFLPILGSGGLTFASSGSGDLVGIGIYGNIGSTNLAPVEGTLSVPLGYVSGSPLSGTSTWDNATFASLGVTPGTSFWFWGSGANEDSFTLQVGFPSPSLPEPSALALLGTALGGLFLFRFRASRRDRRARDGVTP